MRIAGLLLLAFVAGKIVSGAAMAQDAAPSPAARQWWADVSALANDGMKGRMTGTDDYLRAAAYVESRFRQEGLEPAGDNGYRQAVPLEEQVVDQATSHAELVGQDGKVTDLHVGSDTLVSAGEGPRGIALDAPLVFIGYGLHLPAQGHDDFAGLDLKGKVVVVISGGPAEISGAIKSNARFERDAELARRGAVGVITLVTPHQVEIPWDRRKLLARQPGMYLDDAALRDTPDGFFEAGIDPDKSEMLFGGSGHSFADLAALADASRPVPTFALPFRIRAAVTATRRKLTSPNLVAVLPGADPKLKAEYVGVSAHLDHLGVGAPINGDAIYNGAMDDASGVAAVLDIAHKLAAGPRPRRSILFLIVTAEEKGLLGSDYYAHKPTVPKDTIVADLNFDMPLPLWTLKTVYAPGQDESSLGADATAVAAGQGLAMIPDPLPERNVFIRTDQYSFVRRGVPALVFKFGFAKGTPEFDTEHAWRASRYHSPSDDLDQPVMKEEAVKLDALVAGIAARVADADGRPQWLPTSIFGKR